MITYTCIHLIQSLAYSMNPYKLLHTNVTDLPKKGSKSYKSIT